MPDFDVCAFCGNEIDVEEITNCLDCGATLHYDCPCPICSSYDKEEYE